MPYELATLTPEQQQAINALERQIGLALVAYRPYRPETPDGRPQAAAGGYDFEFAAGLEPEPEVLAALNETYRSDEAAGNATAVPGPAVRRRRRRRLRYH